MKINRVSIKKNLNIIESLIDDELESIYDGVHNEFIQIFRKDLDEVNMELTHLIQNQIKEHKEIDEVRKSIANMSKHILNNGEEIIFDYTFNKISKSIQDGGIYKRKRYALKILSMLCSGCGNKNVLYLEYNKFDNKMNDKIAKYILMIKQDSYFEIVEEILYYMDQFNLYASEVNKCIKDNNEKIIESYKKIETLETVKILDHKDMDKHLKEIGYEPVRQKGSHKMYKKEGKTIPVPQHRKDLGKGLSYKIQKQARETIE